MLALSRDTKLSSPAIIEGARTTSYGELQAAIAATRDRLAVHGDLQGARVTFLFAPGLDYVANLFGIWAAGGVAVPLSLKHPRPELQYVIEDTGARKMVVAEAFETSAQELSQCCGIELLVVRQSTPVEAASTSCLNAGQDSGQRAMILYTSGSTGRPKGVVTTHDNIRVQVDSLIEAWKWTNDDHILHVLPLHHIHGVINALCCALRSGATCEFIHPFQSEAVWDGMARGDATLFMAVPTIYAKLISAFEAASEDTQQRWSAGARAMRLHVSGSAALPIPVLEKWEAITGQRLLERYGMTEIGMALSNPLVGDRRPGFVGTPLPFVEARRTLESGAIPAAEEPGEIEVRGPTVFAEYWSRPQETADAFRDGWFRTGDIAVEDAGAFRILGRNSVDIIKTGGYKVSALEIEEVLRTHPDIDDCAVVGIPDEEWGERVAVCLVGRGTLDRESLRQWGKQQLASYKVPSCLQWVEQLPRNAMGKVQKKEVQERFALDDDSNPQQD